MKTLQYTIRTSKQKLNNNKVVIFCTAFLILSWTYDQPYLEFVHEKEYPISWCVFPFYMTSYSILSFFYFGIVYINSDVPFMQHANMYQVIRTGRRRWAICQIGSILVRSLFIVVTSAVSAILPFTGEIELSGDWGKVVRSLASHKSGDLFKEEHSLDFSFSYEILYKFTPVQLMLLTVILCTLICTLLGILMFAISLFSTKLIAIAGGLVYVIGFFIVENTFGRWKPVIAHFVPAYWAEVALIAKPVDGYYRLPPLTYMFTVLIASIIIMSLVICLKVKYIEFNWENEDA